MFQDAEHLINNSLIFSTNPILNHSGITFLSRYYTLIKPLLYFREALKKVLQMSNPNGGGVKFVAKKIQIIDQSTKEKE